MKFSTFPIKKFNNYVCEWSEPNNNIYSLKNNLYRSTSSSSSLEYLGQFPEPIIYRFLLRFSLIRRLLRKSFYNVIPLKNGSYFVSYGRHIGIIKDLEYSPITDIQKPFRVLRSAAAIDENGNVFFGEYSANDYRLPVKIYKYQADNNKLVIVYEFEAGSIRHIHGIYFDKYSKSLWCLCGDVGSENKIIQSFDEFSSVSVIGDGDETWRAVSILFTDKYFYYGMDAEYSDNYIIKVNRKDLQRKKIGKVNGPVYYSYKHNKKLFFAVTAELCASQTDKYASLYAVDYEDKMKRILDFKKDFFSVKYFLPGAFYFPAGPGLENQILFNTVALKNKKCNSFLLKNID